MKMHTLAKRLVHTLIAINIVTFALPIPAFALPEGPTVQSGEVSITIPDSFTLNVNQATDQAIVDWIKFCIAEGETVNFFQPYSSSIALNRVTGGSISEIFGTLNATGNVWLLNPSGVLFGSSARINTAGLLASTLNISNKDFLDKAYVFAKSPDSNGYIINQGQIAVKDGGYVTLLGEAVGNEGVIQAKLGKVVLASGEKMTLELDGEGTMVVAIDGPVSEIVNGVNGDDVEDAVLNTGTISAEGGTVMLTASVLGDIFKRAVNNEGLVEANSLMCKKGEVYLMAEGGNALASNTGTIDVSAVEPGADGGFIEISGDRVRIDGDIEAFSIGGAPGKLLIDPIADFTILNKNPGDDLGGNTVGETWLESRNGFDIIIQAGNDINFELTTDNILDLTNFDTEKFRLEAGNNINLNDDGIRTYGGNIELLADYYGSLNPDGSGDINLGTGHGLVTNGGDVLLSGANVNITSPVDTKGSGGKVTVIAAKNIEHGPNGDVVTGGGDYIANAGMDYTIQDGGTIITVAGTDRGKIDIYANGRITLGSLLSSFGNSFDWEYLGGDRGYKIIEIGYFYVYCNKNELHICPPFVTGTDIRSGSGTETTSIPPDASDFGLYITVKEYDGTVRRYFSNPTLNPDGEDHIKLVRNASEVFHWEDLFYLGDKDFNDIILKLTPADFFLGTYLSGDNVYITSGNDAVYQYAGRIMADRCTYLQAEEDIIVNSINAAKGGVSLRSNSGSIYSTEDPGKNNGGPGRKNVIARGYSYFSAPLGTVGVGTPSDPTIYNPLDVCIQALSGEGYYSAVPTGFTPAAGLTLQIGGDTAPGYMIDTGDGNGPLGVSGAIRLLVRPGVTAITGLYPSPDIDLISEGGIIPPGYIFYEEVGGECCSVLLEPPIRFKNGEAPNAYDIITQIWPGPRIIPPPPPTPPAAGPFGFLGIDLRFKIPRKSLVDTFQIAYTHGPIELTSGQVYFYHPLIEMNMYEVPALGIEMYEFIDGFIRTTNPALLPMLTPLPGEEEKN